MSVRIVTISVTSPVASRNRNRWSQDGDVVRAIADGLLFEEVLSPASIRSSASREVRTTSAGRVSSSERPITSATDFSRNRSRMPD